MNQKAIIMRRIRAYPGRIRLETDKTDKILSKMKITNYVGDEKEDIFAHSGASGTKRTNTIGKEEYLKKKRNSNQTESRKNACN